MAEFVNYKKRSVTLPPGCKDLVDVLKSKGRRGVVAKIGTDTITPNESPAVTHGDTFAGTLSDIEKYVTKAFESRARMLMLIMTPPDGRFTLNVDRMEGGSMDACVHVQVGTEQEKAVRAFFAQHNLCIPAESKDAHNLFVPDVPVYRMCDISPLPLDAAQVSHLMTDLVREAFAFKDDSPLSFHFYELEDAA